MTHHGRPSIKFRRPIFFGPEFREFRTFQRVDPEFFFNFFQSTRGESSFFPECCTPYLAIGHKKNGISVFSDSGWPHGPVLGDHTSHKFDMLTAAARDRKKTEVEPPMNTIYRTASQPREQRTFCEAGVSVACA